MNKCIKGKSCLHCNTDYCRFKDEVAELKAENERLKEECTLYDCGNKEWAIEYKKLEDDYTELIDRLDDISYDKSNYYQALQEIKTLLSQVDENNWLHTGKHIYMDDRCISELKAKIQAKINEVIGANQ